MRFRERSAAATVIIIIMIIFPFSQLRVRLCQKCKTNISLNLNRLHHKTVWMKTYTSTFEIHAPSASFPLCVWWGRHLINIQQICKESGPFVTQKGGLAKHAKNIILLSFSLALLPKTHFLKQMSFRFVNKSLRYTRTHPSQNKFRQSEGSVSSTFVNNPIYFLKCL